MTTTLSRAEYDARHAADCRHAPTPVTAIGLLLGGLLFYGIAIRHDVGSGLGALLWRAEPLWAMFAAALLTGAFAWALLGPLTARTQLLGMVALLASVALLAFYLYRAVTGA